MSKSRCASLLTSVSASLIEIPPWENYPYNLISIWVILKNYAHTFAEIDRLLTELVHLLIALQPDNGTFRRVLESEIPSITEYLEQTNRACQELGLRTTAGLIEKTLGSQPWLYGSLTNELSNIRKCMEIELQGTYFLYIPPSKVQYYDTAFFGEDIEDRFPSIRDDMREAANCFALHRWTAVVHHCMGIIQSSLAVVGKHLRLSPPIDIQTDDWGTIISKLQDGVQQRKRAVTASGTPRQRSQWRKIEPVYNELIADVKTIKDAWRNPTAHFRRSYNEEQAEKVLMRVKDFLSHLVTNLNLRERKRHP